MTDDLRAARYPEMDEATRQLCRELGTSMEAIKARPGGSDFLTDFTLSIVRLSGLTAIDAATLTAIYHALRSYQFGNAAPALAKGLADDIEQLMALGARLPALDVLQ